MRYFWLIWIFIGLSQSVGAFEADQIYVSGFASQGYLKSTVNDYFFAGTEDGTFEFNEFGLSVSANLSAGVRVGLQLFARDLGAYGNDEVTIDWAYAEYRYRDWLGLRAGKIKNPPGLFSQSRDIDAVRTYVFLPQSIYNEIFRENVTTKGGSLFGYTPFGFEYDLLYGDAPLSMDGASVEFIERGFQTHVLDIQAKPVFFGRILWSPPVTGLEGLRIGGSYAHLGFDVLTQNLGAVESYQSRPVFLLDYRRDAFNASFEYRISQTEYEVLASGLIAEQDEELYYGALSYRLNDWLEIGGYYSVSYPDKDDKDGDFYASQGLPAAMGWMKDLALSFRFDATDNFIIKLEGHRLDGLNQVRFDPLDPDDVGFLIATKVTTFF